MKSLFEFAAGRHVRAYLVTVATLIFPGSWAEAQQFELLGGTVNNMSVETFAGVTRNVPTGDPCDPLAPGPFVSDSASSLSNPPLPVFLQNVPNPAQPGQSWDLFYQHNLLSHARGFRRVTGLGWCDCFIFQGSTHRSSAQGMSFVGASLGGGNSTLFVQWRNLSSAWTRNTDHSGSGRASAINSLVIEFQITGVQPGTPVTVYSRHNTSALGWTRHESVAEDPISLRLGQLSVAGNSLVPPGTNPNGHALYDIDGQMSLVAGQPYELVFSSETAARIAPRNRRSGGICIDTFRDNAWAQFMGMIQLGFAPPETSLPGSPGAAGCDFVLLFSVDIGSAAETSMGGTLDPGDLYPQGYSAGLRADLYRNDVDWFGGTDPFPDPADPTSGAPVATGAPVDATRDAFFNLNGAALPGFNLLLHPYGPGQSPLTRADMLAVGTNVSFVLPPSYLLISYADNVDGSFTAPYGAAASNSTGPGGPRGTSAARDEIMQIDLGASGGGAPPSIEAHFSETELDMVLAPNPDLGVSENSDVNALAAVREGPDFDGWADFLYVTAAADARFGLDPGTVYLWDGNPGGQLIPAITPAHLGVPVGTDLNAIEFTWLPAPEGGESALALLFSVARDLPETVEDETGGLAPERVYASFLNGSHFEFGNIQGDADINALALIPCRAMTPPTIVTTSLPPARECAYYSEYLQAAGGFGGVYTWNLSGGALPPGLELESATGRIHGVPTTPGTSLFDITVESPGAGVAVASFSIDVLAPAGPIAVDPAALPFGRVGSWYSATVDAVDACDPVLFRITGGSLPDGLMLDAVAGLIRGIPTKTGVFDFVLTVRDGAGNEASAPKDITITDMLPLPIQLDPQVVPPVADGDIFTIALGATGGVPPYSFTLLGSSPPLPHLSLTGNELEVTASGAGLLVAIDLEIQDSFFSSVQDTLYFLIENGVAGGPELSAPTQFQWAVGESVQAVPTVTGGSPPYQFQWAHGMPPLGLTLDPATGALTGVPTLPGTGVVPWGVTDANGDSAFLPVPFTIWTGYPGGYPVWKTDHGVVDDDEDLDGDNYRAMVEYFFGTDPNQRDQPGLFRIEPAPLGSWFIDFPTAGVADIEATLERYDPAAEQWEPLQSNPFDPAGDPVGIFRLRTEYQP